MLGAANRVYVPSTDLDLAHYKAHTDDTIRAIVRELARLHAAYQARGIAKQSSNTCRSITGGTTSPEGCSRTTTWGLVPRPVLHYEGFHVYAVSGIFHAELQFLLRFLIAHGIAAYRLEAFLKARAWPRDLKPRPTRNMFANYAESNDHFKCVAKVVTHVYQVVRVFLITIFIFLHICQKVLLSMLHLCDVLDLLLEKAVRVTSAQMQSAILQHLQAFQNACDKTGWLRIRHMATRLPLQKLPLLN